MVRVAGLLMGGVVEGQFLGRIEGRGWPRGRIGVRMVGGRIPGGQIRIRRGRVFRGLVLFVVIKMTLRLGQRRVRRQL